MNRSSMVLATLAGLHFVAPVSAADLDLPRNGWASWEVPAVAATPAWCCFDVDGKPASQGVCQLDDKNRGYASRDNAKTDTVRIYARFADGKLERLQALAAACPVQANSEIRKLAPTEQASVQWLAGLLEKDAGAAGRSRSDLLAALAAHRTPLAFDALARISRQDTPLQQRKEAVFWLAHLRGREGAELTTSLMFNDPDARMREHAAFALTRSESPRITEDLIRLATSDRERKVRGQGWFWLAQTGATQTERAIDAALSTETDRHVREQAIFALSQLPEERALRALISIVENKARPWDDRKKALFWMAHSGSDGAMAYLDKVVGAAEKR